MEYLYCQHCDNYLGCPTGVSDECPLCGWQQPKEQEGSDDE